MLDKKYICRFRYVVEIPVDLDRRFFRNVTGREKTIPSESDGMKQGDSDGRQKKKPPGGMPEGLLDG